MANSPIQSMPPNISADILEEKNKDYPDISLIKKFLLEEYARQTGVELTVKSATNEELAELSRWFNRQFMGGLSPLVTTVKKINHALVHSNFSGKSIRLAQRHCTVCQDARPSKDMFPAINIPIRITPVSRQATKSRQFKAFQAAIAHRLQKTNFRIEKTDRLCVTITYILRSAAKDRDLDNMTKALQDAISRAMGFDDAHIHHLDVMKLIFDDDDEHVSIGIAPSYLNEHGDVLAPHKYVNWAGQEPLDLADYMPPE